MSNKFFPDQFIETKSSNGTSHSSMVFSSEAWANLHLVTYIILFFVGLIVIPVASLILMLSYCIFVSNKNSWYNAIGAGLSFYYLVDMSLGWILSSSIKLFYDNIELDTVLHINFGMLISHIIFLVLGPVLYELVGKNILRILVLIVSVIMFFISKEFFFGDIMKTFIFAL